MSGAGYHWAGMQTDPDVSTRVCSTREEPLSAQEIVFRTELGTQSGRGKEPKQTVLPPALLPAAPPMGSGTGDQDGPAHEGAHISCQCSLTAALRAGVLEARKTGERRRQNHALQGRGLRLLTQEGACAGPEGDNGCASRRVTWLKPVPSTGLSCLSVWHPCLGDVSPFSGFFFQSINVTRVFTT